MVIILTPQGQLSNRILHASHFIANALEFDYQLFHLSFEDYYKHFSEQFELAENQKIIKFITIRNSFLKGIIYLLVRIFRIVYVFNRGNFLFFYYYYLPQAYWKKHPDFDLTSAVFTKRARKIVFIDGWEFRNEILFQKHSETIVNIFKPNMQYRQVADIFINQCRDKYDILIGVHIRKGDYKEFNDGLFYFTDELYKERMKQLLNFNSFSGKKVLFVICSNEEIDITGYDGLTVEYSQRHFMVDLLILSACDLIIGPPSTFSMWASYYGDTPLCFLTKEEQQLSMEMFRVHGK